MPVTGKDIAEKLGLSPSTVSQALNNKGSLKSETVALVRRTAKEMGYQHSKSDGSGHELRSKTVPVILSGTAQGGHRRSVSGLDSKVLAGIDHALSGHDARSMLTTELQLDRLLQPDSFGALIIGGYASRETLGFLETHAIPTVAIASPIASPIISSVQVDVIAGVRTAVEHLKDLGHERIALLNGPPETLASDLKLTGYLRGLFDCGIEVRSDWIKSLERNVQSSREEVFRLLPGDWSGITSILCAYEEIAIAVLQVAKELGLQVPGDLSVVSYHDEGIAELAVPPITTVALAPERLGRLSVQQLLALERDPDLSGTQLLVPAQLNVRSSTGRRRES